MRFLSKVTQQAVQTFNKVEVATRHAVQDAAREIKQEAQLHREALELDELSYPQASA